MQLEAYRDQYATMFNNGRKVTLLAISVDPDTTLASWAREAAFPFLLVRDSAQTIGELYGSTRGARHARNVFVIGPDGRIAHRMVPFGALSQDDYEALEKAVDAAAGTSGPR